MRPFGLEFVNANHNGQWWSDCMTDDDCDLYIENFIMNNWDSYVAFIAAKEI